MDEKLSQAISLFNAGQKQEAVKLLTEILKSDPSNSHAWYGMALCHEDIEKKKYCLNRVLALDPSNTRARQLLDKIIIFDTPENPKVTTQVSLPKEQAFRSYKTVIIASAIVITALIGVILTMLLVNRSKNSSPVAFINKSTATITPLPTLSPTPSPTPLPLIFEKHAKEYLPNQDEMPIGFLLSPDSVENKTNNSSDSLSSSRVAFSDESKALSGDLYTALYSGEILKNEEIAKRIFQSKQTDTSLSNIFMPFETFMNQQGIDVVSKTDFAKINLTTSISNVDEYSVYNASYNYGISTVGVYYLIFRNKNFVGTIVMLNQDPFSLGKYPTTGNSHSRAIAYYASLVTDKLVIP